MQHICFLLVGKPKLFWWQRRGSADKKESDQQVLNGGQGAAGSISPTPEVASSTLCFHVSLEISFKPVIYFFSYLFKYLDKNVGAQLRMAH